MVRDQYSQEDIKNMRPQSQSRNIAGLANSSGGTGGGELRLYQYGSVGRENIQEREDKR